MTGVTKRLATAPRNGTVANVAARRGRRDACAARVQAAASTSGLGILPLTFADGGDYAKIEEGDELEIPGAAAAIASGAEMVVKNKTQGLDVPVTCNLTERQREIILAGGALALQRSKAGG